VEFRIIRSALVLLLSAGLIAVSTPATLAAEFDLSSQNGSVQVTPEHLGGGSAIVNVGGTPRTVNVGDTLTAAEFVALQQIVTGGTQNLGLDAAGRAVSGNFNVHSLPQSVLNSLTIPTGVSAIHNFAASNTLNLVGNLTNNGTLYAVSTNSGTTVANIAASNIFNNVNALLTSVLPANGLAGYQSAIGGLNLNLTAINDIINAGTISSAGSLTASAGGSIVNSGSAALMQAIGNINLNSANLTNAGLIASTNANLNMATAGNLFVNNAGGRLEALNGAINVRDTAFSSKSNTTLAGGDWIAKALNINSGQGKVNVNVGEVVGTVNVNAGELHLTAASDNLTLGSMNLTGDPTFFNTDGDVVLTADIHTNGFPLAIVAAGDITGTAITTIDTSDAAGDSGAIIMVAGATFTSNPFAFGQQDDQTGTTLEITDFTFGRIDFNGSTLGSITTNAGGTDLAGGNITLVALGEIDLGTASVTADGDGVGSNGNIKVIVGSGFGDFTAGFIHSMGGTGGGDVEVLAATPVISASGDPCNCVRIMPDGSIDPSAGEFIAGTPNFGGSAAPGPVTAAGNLKVSFPTLLAALYADGDIIVESKILDLDADLSAGGNLSVTANRLDTHGSIMESRSPSGTVTFTTEADPSGTLPRSLSLTGGGFINGPGGISFTAGNGAVSFDDTFIMTGDVDIQALGPNGVVGASPSGSVTGNGNIEISGVALLNQSAFRAANELTFDMNLFEAPQGGYGTIANSLGDVNLMTNIVALGQNLTILAAGNVNAGPAFKLIDLSSKTTAGGSLNIVAGVSFTPGTNGLVLDKTTVYELLGPSASGGSVNMPNVMVVTTSFSKQAGDVSINAFRSATNPGSVKIGNMFANAKTTTENGGNIQIYGYGGVSTGKIDTTGAAGGDVTIVTSAPALDGTIYFQNGTRGGAGAFTSQFTDLPVAPGNITVGLIKADGFSKNGGLVELSSAANISSADISATGVSAPLPSVFDDTPTAGGSIYITAASGHALLGNLDVSGRGVNPTAQSGSAGTISVFAGSMDINKISANGAANVDDAAGNGGAVMLTTTSIGGVQPDGEILVRGAITATGGFSKNALCGTGGSVNIDAGTFRSLASGVSINASAGSPLQSDPEQGTVRIETYGSQPVPVNFNTADTTKTEFALPGGLFYLGQGAGTAAAGSGASVNGTNGDIVVGSYSGKSDANAKRVVDGSPVSLGSGKILVAAHGSSQAITQPGTASISVDGGTVGSARTKVTPAQALALYQLTRGNTQTVNLNASGQAAPGSSVDIQGTDVRSFTNFVINTSDSTPTIAVNFTGLQVFLPLNNSKSNLINGTLNFTGDPFFNNSFARMELNDKPLTIQAGAQIIGNDDTAVTFTNAATINNNGTIRLADLTLSNVGGKIEVNMDANGLLGGPLGGGELVLNGSTININGGSLIDTLVDLGPDAEGKADFVVADTKFTTSFLRSMSAKRISILSLSGMILPGPVTLNATGLLGIAVNGPLVVNGSTLTSADKLSLTSFGNSIRLDSGSTLTSKKDMNITAGTNLTMDTNVSLLSTGGKMLLSANPTNGVIIGIQDSIVAVGGVTLSANDVSIADSSFNSSSINTIVNVNAKYANIVASQNALADSTLYVAKLTSTSADGGMTIAVNGGDIRLMNDIVMPGANLSLISNGSITGDKKISLGSKTANGGNLTMLAGMQPFGTPDVNGKLTGVSVSTNPFANGNIQINNSIDTSTEGGFDAGNITLYATNSDPFDGASITANKVTANSKSAKFSNTYISGEGGDIFIAGPGLLAFDGVESIGFPGGSIQIYGYNPDITGSVSYFDGGAQSGTISLPAAGPFSQIQIAGNVYSKSSMPAGVQVTPEASNRGTSINMWSSKEVKVTGTVMTEGESPINIQTIGGIVNIGKDLLAVGNADVLGGGDISITGSTFVTVNGNISAVGGPGGGSGGNLTITTPALPSTAHVGSILVKGFIATDGTSGSALFDFGNGGDVTIRTGTLQVNSTISRGPSQPFPASILSAAGVTFGTPGTPGDVDIVTYGTQPVPLNFNPLSTQKTEVALPGGIFEVGNAAVNGTKGGIISGSTLAYDAVSTASAANYISSATFTSTGGDVVIATWIDAVAITQDGRAPGPPPNNYNVFASNGIGTPRNMLTPGEAMAVYQASHAVPQTVNVNASGQLKVGSVFTAQEYEVVRPFNTFVVNSTNPTGGGMTFQVLGSAPVLDLQKASLIDHSGGIRFDTPGADAVVLLGAKPLSMKSFIPFMEGMGSISLFGKAGTWTMKGDISAPTINIHHTGGALTLDMGTSGTLHGFLVPTEVRFTGPAGLTVVGGNFRGATVSVDGPTLAKSVYIGKGTATKFNTSGFGDHSYVGTIRANGSVTINAENAPSTPLRIAAGSEILSDLADITIASTTDLDIGNFAEISAHKLLQIGAAGTITVGSLSEFLSRGNLSLVGSGDVNIGSGTTFTSSGDMFVNSMQGNVTFNGTNSLETGKSLVVSGALINSLAPNNVFRANGDKKASAFSSIPQVRDALQFSSTQGIYLTGSNTFSAPKGGIGFYDFGGAGMAIGDNIFSGGKTGVIFASGGSVGINVAAQNVNSTGPITVGGMPAIGSAPAQSFSGNITTNGYWATDSNITLQTSADVKILAGSSMNAGRLAALAPNAGVLSKANVATAGAISISGNDIALPFLVGAPVSLASNGGDLTVRATGNITFGGGTNAGDFRANGGSLSMLALGDITGGNGNNFVARGVGTPASTLGGGIEVAAGTLTSRLHDVFQLPAGSAPDPSLLGTNVRIYNEVRNVPTGAVWTPIGGGIVDLSFSPTNRSNLNLDRGAILIDADGASQVLLDGATFTTADYFPIAHTTSILPPQTLSGEVEAGDVVADIAHAFTQDREHRQVISASVNKSSAVFHRGSAFIQALTNMAVKTNFGDVVIKKGAMVALDSTGGALRVKSCSGPGHTTVRLAGKSISLAPGQELLVSTRKPTKELLAPADGVGRRMVSQHSLMSDLHIAVSDISLVSYLQNAHFLSHLRASTSPVEKRMLGALLKTAASIETVTRARGAYTARPKKPGSERDRKSNYTTAYAL
jgi:hypothetical protein